MLIEVYLTHIVTHIEDYSERLILKNLTKDLYDSHMKLFQKIIFVMSFSTPVFMRNQECSDLKCGS